MRWLVLVEMGRPLDLTALQGLELKELCIEGTKVFELSPLKDMPLDLIRLTPRAITQGLEVLRDTKSLKTIAIDSLQARWPAEFWTRYNRGAFK